MKNDINSGYKVVIWPSNIEQKDINSMIVNGGFSEKDILNVLKNNTYQGLFAEIQLNKWKKVG